MDDQHVQGYTKFLKKAGKQEHVTARLVLQVERFEVFLAARNKALDQVNKQDVDDYVAHLEAQQAGQARKAIRGVALYYKYLEQPALAALFNDAREAAIEKTRKPFLLADFIGVDPTHIARLRAVGARTAEQLLSAGKTPQLRQELAERSGVPIEVILELVKLSDLTRIYGVKAIRARLYYDAGVDTVEKLAAFEPEELLKLTAEFVQRTDFDGIAPLPKEVSSTIETARHLPKIIEL